MSVLRAALGIAIPADLPFAPRPSDDPFFRVAIQAEKRARLNGIDPSTASKAAIENLRADPEKDHERAVRAAAGEYRRVA